MKQNSIQHLTCEEYLLCKVTALENREFFIIISKVNYIVNNLSEHNNNKQGMLLFFIIYIHNA